MLKDDYLARLNELADNEAKKNTQIHTVYKALVQIAERWEKETDNLYGQRRVCCLLAARILLSDKLAVVF